MRQARLEEVLQYCRVNREKQTTGEEERGNNQGRLSFSSAFQIIVLRGVPNTITLYITKVAGAMLYMHHRGNMDIGNRLAVSRSVPAVHLSLALP